MWLERNVILLGLQLLYNIYLHNLDIISALFDFPYDVGKNRIQEPLGIFSIPFVPHTTTRTLLY